MVVGSGGNVVNSSLSEGRSTPEVQAAVISESPAAHRNNLRDIGAGYRRLFHRGTPIPIASVTTNEGAGMYVIRRVWAVEPRQTRLAASLVSEIGRLYEDAGQREPVRVYFNAGSLPGEKDRVYMEWTTRIIESPHRGDNEFPSDPRSLGARLREITTGTWIEFYELMTPDKAVDID